jgi:hypothetical protein
MFITFLYQPPPPPPPPWLNPRPLIFYSLLQVNFILKSLGFFQCWGAFRK